MSLSPLKAQLLAALRERPQLDAAFLAALVRRTQGSVATALRALKEQGLVRIRYSPVCTYALTNDGYSACEQFQAHQNGTR